MARWYRLLIDHDYEREYGRFLDGLNTFLVAEARAVTHASERLKVGQIVYASPGNIDLLGIEKVLETFAIVLNKLVDFIAEAPLRRERAKQAEIETEREKIEVKKEKESLTKMKLNNARKFVELMKGCDPAYREMCVESFVRDQETMFLLIVDGELVGVSVVEPKEVVRRKR